MDDGEPISGAGKALSDFYIMPIVCAIIIAIVSHSFWFGLMMASVVGATLGAVTAARSYGAWRDFGRDIPLPMFVMIWIFRGFLSVIGWSIPAIGIGLLVRWLVK